jgi:hypothetical protein
MMELRMAKKAEIEKNKGSKSIELDRCMDGKIYRANSLPDISSPYFTRKRLLDITPEKQQQKTKKR